MLTDPISDFLTQLRNASRAHKTALTVRSSRMLKSIAEVLAKKGFVASATEGKNDKKVAELTVVLRNNREPLELKRISKPGQRIYINYKNIKRVRNGLGIGIISTSSGILSGEEARQKKVGGEYLCEVY